MHTYHGPKELTNYISSRVIKYVDTRTRMKSFPRWHQNDSITGQPTNWEDKKWVFRDLYIIETCASPPTFLGVPKLTTQKPRFYTRRCKWTTNQITYEESLALVSIFFTVGYRMLIRCNPQQIKSKVKLSQQWSNEWCNRYQWILCTSIYGAIRYIIS